jgi:hypothetical protein
MINFELIPAGTTLQTFDTGLPIRLVVCLGADRSVSILRRQAGIPVGTTFFFVENDHDIEAIYWPHISSGTGFLQNSILAE